jgi:hypothetical protein
MLRQIRWKSKSHLKNVLSLDEFIFRQKVLSTYRDIIRLINSSHEKKDLLEFVKHEFKANIHETDLTHRKYLLNMGITRINKMIPVLGLDAKHFKHE